ncbi:acyl-CoA dehydrogenase family protein [Thalassovita taeanensis]|uniref:Acyl-[acyl-carrier-protein] dehydrogenase MbtN n=1 Tax=Thalassovita taeanensis TaxID=657014 RepID=A0A1H9BVD4_9RHOB|nr:acyl-CoA dehydrogenase family protein [Thalassovita taeanensis]SEP92882.1 acyl-CoA dehydrogenase [Thalassovita taeanensis]
MTRRTLFDATHDMFRETVRRFIEDEIAPFHDQWERDGIVPRALWRKAGALGLLCTNMPEEYGGGGTDWTFNAVLIEEMWRAGVSGPAAGFMIQSEMVAPYILAWGSEAMKRRILPRMARGELVGAIAMTEPGAGSDLKAITTRAVRTGDDYVVSGQKVYISNGQSCDVIVMAVKTDASKGAAGVSLILAEVPCDGFERGRNLDKIGMHAQDTSELFFDNMRVPAANLLGDEGQGFAMLMTKLAHERMSQAVRSVAVAEASLRNTIEYTKERRAFGGTIADFQNTQFVLAQLDAEITAARVFTDWAVEQFMLDALDPLDAARLKLVTCELQGKVVDQCLQFFGGYGYMTEYPIARAFVDARISRIAGGAVEVMKHIIARDVFK